MRNAILRQDIIENLKENQVALATVATALGYTFRTLERYLEAAKLYDTSQSAYKKAHKKLTTPACLIAIQHALGTMTPDELLEKEETATV